MMTLFKRTKKNKINKNYQNLKFNDGRIDIKIQKKKKIDIKT